MAQDRELSLRRPRKSGRTDDEIRPIQHLLRGPCHTQRLLSPAVLLLPAVVEGIQEICQYIAMTRLWLTEAPKRLPH